MIHSLIYLSKYLWLSFKIDLKKMIVYPTAFWFTFFTIPLFAFVNIIFIETIFGQTSSFVGYTKYEAYLLFGTYRIVQSICYFMFYFRLAELKYLIRGDSEETFDQILTKPIDAQLYATMGRFSFGHISSIIVGLTICWYAITTGHIVFEPMHWISYITLILCGIFLLHLLFLAISTLLFWTQQLDAAEGLWDALKTFGQYPTNLYHGMAGTIFNFVVPITLMGSIPVNVLLGKTAQYMVFVYISIIVTLFLVTRLFWQISIKKYSSFSS